MTFAMGIGGVVGIGGIEEDKLNEKRENTHFLCEPGCDCHCDCDCAEIAKISQNQQEVIDFYYQIKEYFLKNSEMYNVVVPSKRKQQNDYETDYNHATSMSANTELNIRLSQVFMCPQPTAPIPIPPPNPNYCVRTAITEPKN